MLKLLSCLPGGLWNNKKGDLLIRAGPWHRQYTQMLRAQSIQGRHKWRMKIKIVFLFFGVYFLCLPIGCFFFVHAYTAMTSCQHIFGIAQIGFLLPLCGEWGCFPFGAARCACCLLQRGERGREAGDSLLNIFLFSHFVDSRYNVLYAFKQARTTPALYPKSDPFLKDTTLFCWIGSSLWC